LLIAKLVYIEKIQTIVYTTNIARKLGHEAQNITSTLRLNSETRETKYS